MHESALSTIGLYSQGWCGWRPCALSLLARGGSRRTRGCRVALAAADDQRSCHPPAPVGGTCVRLDPTRGGFRHQSSDALDFVEDRIVMVTSDAQYTADRLNILGLLR